MSASPGIRSPRHRLGLESADKHDPGATDDSMSPELQESLARYYRSYAHVIGHVLPIIGQAESKEALRTRLDLLRETLRGTVATQAIAIERLSEEVDEASTHDEIEGFFTPLVQMLQHRIASSPLLPQFRKVYARAQFVWYAVDDAQARGKTQDDTPQNALKSDESALPFAEGPVRLLSLYNRYMRGITAAYATATVLPFAVLGVFPSKELHIWLAELELDGAIAAATLTEFEFPGSISTDIVAIEDRITMEALKADEEHWDDRFQQLIALADAEA